MQTHVKAPLQTFEPTSARFGHVHVDLVGPLPESKGHKYLLTIIDRFTRWPAVVPLKDIETKAIASAYIQNWVARFGVPEQMTSDRGTQFVSELWAAMAELLGTQLNPTTAYHPQANGLVERLHRTLKAALKARLTGPNWVDELPWVLLGLRTTPKEDLNTSPAKLVYGSPLTVPGDFIPKCTPVPTQEHLRNLREKMDSLRPVPTSAHGANKRQFKVPTSLSSAKFVFIRRETKKPLETPYTGPYEVLTRQDKYYTLQVGPRKEKVSVDRLKPAVVDDKVPVQVAQPPKRGRPQGKTKQNQSLQDLQAKQPEEESLPIQPTYAEVTSRYGRVIRPPVR